MSNSWWSRMIKSHPPAHDAIERRDQAVFHKASEEFFMFVCQLSRRARHTLLMRPSGPCSLNRIIQSRASADPCRRIRAAPSSTAAITNDRRACAAFFIRCAIRRRHSSYSPLANDHPFATLNHFSRFWNPERVRLPEAWYKTIRWCPLSKRRLRATVRLLAAHAPSLYVRSSDPPCV